MANDWPIVVRYETKNLTEGYRFVPVDGKEGSVYLSKTFMKRVLNHEPDSATEISFSPTDSYGQNGTVITYRTQDHREKRHCFGVLTDGDWAKDLESAVRFRKSMLEKVNLELVENESTLGVSLLRQEA